MATLDSQLFQLIFDQSPISTQIFDPSGEILYVNRAWERMWKVTLKDVGSYNILQDKQLEEAGVMSYIKEAFDGKKVTIPVIKYIPKKSIARVAHREHRLTKGIAYPIRNSKGKIQMVVLQHEDVTNQLVQEEKLRESERLFKSITDNSLDGVRLIDENGKILYASLSTSRILGYSVAEYKKLNIIDLVHPEDRERYKQSMRDLIANPKKPVYLRYRIQHKNGTWRWMDGVGRNFLNDPDIKGMLSTYQDITERKVVEDRLWNTNQTLKTIIQASPLAVYVVDTSGTVIMWSTMAEKMFGWKAREIIGEKLPIVQEEMRSEFDNHMKKLLSGGTFTSETVRMRKDRTLFDVSISAAPILDENGKTESIVAIAMDITERKRLEKQKDEFMAIASHELKTPVTSLKAYAQVLEKRFRKKGDDESASFLQKMDGQIDKLTVLIRDLLDVTKIEGGKLQFSNSLFAVRPFVDEIIEEVQRTTEKHKIIKRGSTDKKIYGDRDRIGQVLTNFLTNAVKYSPDSEKVLVSVKENDDFVKIGVRDFGIGIPKHAQESIFQRFYRVVSPHHNTIPGIGLGLYISAEIIKRQGGTIGFKSREHEGTTFYFTVPVSNSND